MTALASIDETPTLEPPALGLSSYVAIARRRKRQFLVPFAVVFAIAVIVVIAVPPKYRSVATVLVETQQIPDELVRSTITAYADEQIEFIRQKVLTRSNILDVVQRFNLYASTGRTEPSTLVDRFRKDLEIDIVDAALGGKGRRPTVSLTIGFLSESPTMAQQVANELVTLFLNENARSRAERAAETTAFLAEEGEKIRSNIQQVEEKLAAFKRDNREILPEVMQMNMGLMERTERDYRTTSVALEGLFGQLRVAEMELQQYRSSAAASGPSGGLPSVASLQAQYDELIVGHTERHPDVIRVKRMLEDARAREARLGVLEQNGILNEQLAGDPAYGALTRQIEAMKNQVAYLERNKAELSTRLEAIEQRVSHAPEVEKEYANLQRDLANLTAKYQDMKDKELGARVAQSLEEERKGERFTLLEPALVPTEPFEPNPLKLMSIGTFAAFAAGIATMVIAEAFDNGLRGAALHRALGMAPLVTIPIIDRTRDMRRRRARSLVGTLLWLAIFAGVAFAVHVYWMPLDVLLYRVINRVSLMQSWIS